MSDAGGGRAGAARVVLLGLGNPLRGDDAAGLDVARMLAPDPDYDVRAHSGEPLELLELLGPYRAAVIVDALRSGAEPGTRRRIDLTRERLPAQLRTSTSTHAIGLGEALELARALGRLPARAVLHLVEGQSFGAGAPLSAPVSSALPALRTALESELRTLAHAP